MVRIFEKRLSWLDYVEAALSSHAHTTSHTSSAVGNRRVPPLAAIPKTWIYLFNMRAPTPLPPPGPLPTVITVDALNRARVELEERAQAVSVGEVNQEGVAIAYDVPSDELDRVPDEWLEGIELQMRADGEIVAVLREPRMQASITFDALERARVQLQARAQAVAAGENVDDVDCVVLAHGVSQEDLDQIPDEWRRGLELLMCEDGTVLAILEASNAHRDARDEVKAQVVAYVRANAGFAAARSPPLPQGVDRLARPDVALLQRNANLPPPNNYFAIALFKVEDKSRSGPDMIETAAEYLTIFPREVECVVAFKFYPPREVALQRHNQLRVPAIALVFRRGHGTVTIRGRQRGRVVVTQSQVFGNEPLDTGALRCFSGRTIHPALALPADVAAMAAFPAFHGPVDLMNFHASLAEALQVARAIDVPMPGTLAPIHVDLASVFDGIVRGMERDLPPAVAPPVLVAPPVAAPAANVNANADVAAAPNANVDEDANPDLDVDMGPGAGAHGDE